ncbi:MAG TPA: N-acetyltransferase [Ruminococcus sp.]|nr:N-acetyltransferase [Ruminococcus sp.]
MKHSGTQTIDTERLILRRFTADDAADMLANWAADPAVQHEYGEPVYETAEAVEGLLQNYLSGYARADFYRWAIAERLSGQNIGMIAFCRVYDDIRAAEIEYCIGGAFQGNGYAGEALRAVITYSFLQTEFDKLEAYHRAENVKSGRVLEKSAMHRTETVERFRRAGESPEGEVCYCITRETGVSV